jgi:hypothetical protein
MSQDYFDSLPEHYINVTVEAIVRNWLIGQWVVVNCPVTDDEPYRTIDVKEAKIEAGRIFIRGENTDWFGEESFKINICPF